MTKKTEVTEAVDTSKMVPNLWQKLAYVQQKAVARKDKTNKFQGYNYRNVEGIVAAVKPILAEMQATLQFSDEIIIVGDRIYCRAEVRFIDLNTGEYTSSFASARENLEKYNKQGQPSMDHSQLTGSASTYARRYAVQGLLLLDEHNDPDSLNVDEWEWSPKATPIPTNARDQELHEREDEPTETEGGVARSVYDEHMATLGEFCEARGLKKMDVWNAIKANFGKAPATMTAQELDEIHFFTNEHYSREAVSE